MHEKKAFSVVPKASPWRPNHVTICLLRHSGESLQKWPTRALKTKLILRPRDQQRYSRISLSLSGRILKEYQNIVSASKQTPCGIPWGLRNRTHWSARYTNGRDARSKKVSSFEMYKFNPLSPHCGSIARELVHCYTWDRLRIVTVRGNTVGQHS